MQMEFILLTMSSEISYALCGLLCLGQRHCCWIDKKNKSVAVVGSRKLALDIAAECAYENGENISVQTFSYY